MRPVVLSKALDASSVDCVAQSQSLAGAGNFALNGSAVAGGVAALDTQRRVLITSTGNDSAIAFTVFGTTQNGTAIQENVPGGNAAAVATNQDFLTVTRVAASGATASTVQVGTNSVGSTPWVLADQHVTPGNIALGALITAGSVSYTGEYTYDDFLNLAAGAYPTPRTVVGLTNQSVSSDAQLGFPVKGWRLTVNSGTGTVSLTGIQAGIRQ